MRASLSRLPPARIPCGPVFGSRAVGRGRRPQAAALVAALAAPPGWAAIVVGEYERAFYGAVIRQRLAQLRGRGRVRETPGMYANDCPRGTRTPMAVTWEDAHAAGIAK